MGLSFKLDNFEGPLELLLHLIETKEMSIHEISISKLIDEYLELMAELKKDEIQIKVEFLVMATELLEIKALSILNYKEKELKEKSLEKKLIEYKVIKELSYELQSMENEYNISYKREGLDVVLEDLREIDLTKLSLKVIFDTYFKVMKETEEKETMDIDIEEVFSMNDEMNLIEKLLKENNKISCENIFEKANSKLHLVYMFLAILELYREKIVEICEEYLIYGVEERGI